jgi:hypothetical protein
MRVVVSIPVVSHTRAVAADFRANPRFAFGGWKRTNHLKTVEGWKAEGKEENAGSLQNGGIMGGLEDQNVMVREPRPETGFRGLRGSTCY